MSNQDYEWSAPEIPTAAPATAPAPDPYGSPAPYGAPDPYGAATPAPYGAAAGPAPYTPGPGQDPYGQAMQPPHGNQPTAYGPSPYPTYPQGAQMGWHPVLPPYPKQGQAIVILVLGVLGVLFAANLLSAAPLILGIIALAKSSTDHAAADKLVKWGWITHIIAAAVWVLVIVVYFAFVVFMVSMTPGAY